MFGISCFPKRMRIVFCRGVHVWDWHRKLATCHVLYATRFRVITQTHKHFLSIISLVSEIRRRTINLTLNRRTLSATTLIIVLLMPSRQSVCLRQLLLSCWTGARKLTIFVVVPVNMISAINISLSRGTLDDGQRLPLSHSKVLRLTRLLRQTIPISHQCTNTHATCAVINDHLA